MSSVKTPLEVIARRDDADICEEMDRSALSAAHRQPVATLHAARTARLEGFDLEGRPLIGGIGQLPGEVVCAQTTVVLGRTDIGSAVVVVFDADDPRQPIVLGVIQKPVAAAARPDIANPSVLAQVDDRRVVLSAEREVVLRCGDASITLTHAGKVIIRGKYIVSTSSGYNKIKGAAVAIN